MQIKVFFYHKRKFDFSKLFEDLWDSDTPKLTKLGNRFKDTIFNMRESGIPEFESYAFAVTLWSWAYLPQMSRNPDLSGYLNVYT